MYIYKGRQGAPAEQTRSDGFEGASPGVTGNGAPEHVQRAMLKTCVWGWVVSRSRLRPGWAPVLAPPPVPSPVGLEEAGSPRLGSRGRPCLAAEGVAPGEAARRGGYRRCPGVAIVLLLAE